MQWHRNIPHLSALSPRHNSSSAHCTPQNTDTALVHLYFVPRETDYNISFVIEQNYNVKCSGYILQLGTADCDLIALEKGIYGDLQLYLSFKLERSMCLLRCKRGSAAHILIFTRIRLIYQPIQAPEKYYLSAECCRYYFTKYANISEQEVKTCVFVKQKELSLLEAV